MCRIAPEIIPTHDINIKGTISFERVDPHVVRCSLIMARRADLSSEGVGGGGLR